MAIRSGPLQPDAIKVGFEVGLPALLERPDKSSFHAIGKHGHIIKRQLFLL